ncbi:hypothetical protein [Kitasatospora sp. NPDC050543]|uniref:hypothetical protein n=1 Tax=Kitasatospora sp. NPDC050543 TaxID=3364054 RepID=UPI0037B4270C
MPALLWWAIPAAVALTALAVVHPHGPAATLRATAAIWIALTIVALPLLLSRS